MIVIFYTACLVIIFIYSIFILTNNARSAARSTTSNPSNTTAYNAANTSPSSSNNQASSHTKTLADLASSSPSASLFLASGQNSLLDNFSTSCNDPNYLEELAKQPLPSLNMAAKSFPQDANERMRSFHERKQALIDAAKARYLRKHLQQQQKK